MTVGEWFTKEQITKEMLHEVSNESDYWYKAANFILDKWDEYLYSFSAKQEDWATRIRDDMTEKRIEGNL